MNPHAHVFHFEAMATSFTLSVCAEEHSHSYAAQAADVIHREVQRLEDELSRFKPGSEICQLSSLPAGQPHPLTLAAWDCLSLAKALHQETDGAFDITISPLMPLCRQPDGSARQPSPEEIAALKQAIGSQHFDLNPDQLSITLHRSPMAFDLGGLGKGYALDQCADLLNQWSIHNALINAGNSTLLASGKLSGHSGWPVTLDADHHHRIIQLQDQALSASGFAEQGAHIIDPRSLRAIPTTQQRSYVIAPTAALADALSTTFQILSPTEARALCQKLPGIQHLQATHPAPDLP